MNAADRLAFNVPHELMSQINADLGELADDYDVPGVARSLYGQFGPGWFDLAEVPEATYREILLRLPA